MNRQSDVPRDLFDEIQELAESVVSRHATEQQRQRLEQLVTQNDDACELYVDYMNESLAIRRLGRVRQLATHCRNGGRSAVVPLASRPRRRFGSLFAFGSAPVVVAAIVAVGLLFALWTHLWNAGVGTAPDVTVVGSLTRSANVQWAVGAHRWSVGDTLAEGQSIEFDSGRVELQFDSGALMTVVGPAALEIKSVNLVALHSGTATTRIEDGNSGKFRVVTPATEVLDLGTEFGVRARPDGQTDVVVFEGKVDVTPVAGGRGPATQTLSVGEAVCVNSAGERTRIVSIASDAFPFGDAMFNVGRTRPPVISEVTDDLRSPEGAKFYRIYHEGLVEDARAFVDRIYEWNGLTEDGMPSFLRGADYVATFNDDKYGGPEITVELSGPALLYILYDDRLVVPAWLSEAFEDTGLKIGLDGGHEATCPDRCSTCQAGALKNWLDNGHEWPVMGVGAGWHVDRPCSIWRRRVAEAGPVRLGRVGSRKPGENGEAMYGIAAQPERTL